MAEGRRSDRGFVVVTGTSTGIGAATVSRLASLGFRVFAGVRRAEDAESVRNAANGTVTPLMIDIRDGTMIASAVKTVDQVVAERGLVGLVNNAGVVKPGPLELQPLDDFRRQLEVNLIGPLAVIQAFLPLLRRGGGRIVNVGSIGGLLVLPIQGAYSASKFGLEALSDALRLELRQWTIPVSHVDPGVTDTPIFGKTLIELERALAALHERGHDEYDAQFAAIRKVVEKSPDSARRPTIWPRRLRARSLRASRRPATTRATAQRRRSWPHARSPTTPRTESSLARSAYRGPSRTARREIEMGDEKPTVLFVHYSFTKQTEMVVDAMADEMTARGCTVTKAPLEFPDAHYGGRFSKLPMPWPILHIVGMLVAQRRRKTGDIIAPPEAQNGAYDLIVFGSPTWWLTTCMPVRSYLQSPAANAVLDGTRFAAVSVSRRYYKGNVGDIKKLGEQAGGRWAGGTHFVSDGNQVMSMA